MSWVSIALNNLDVIFNASGVSLLISYLLNIYIRRVCKQSLEFKFLPVLNKGYHRISSHLNLSIIANFHVKDQFSMKLLAKLRRDFLISTGRYYKLCSVVISVSFTSGLSDNCVGHMVLIF